MASISLTTFLVKSHNARAIVVRNPWSSRVFISAAPHPLLANVRHEATTTQACDKAADAAKQGANEARRADDPKNQGCRGKVADTAQDLTEKAKQTAQDAWDTVKDTTQKIKETVVGKAEDSKESIKENAENVKRSMKN
ncbi:uncharacterized protein At4g13230-like [Actinidia eriantha]|uniref:uncharacterized protein At4g13230-like n=1 Tax=Actinidia eriantha TaxID=165200 RepID=UPI00258CE5D4|nr:uncharacterized protein At4g13230-like [Actinidia eriantha]